MTVSYGELLYCFGSYDRTDAADSTETFSNLILHQTFIIKGQDGLLFSRSPVQSIFFKARFFIQEQHYKQEQTNTFLHLV